MDKFLCVATCWSDDFLSQLKEEGLDKKVYELFGSLDTSIIGSGRPSSGLPKVFPKEAKQHIERAHSIGIKFNYLLNAPCLGNREYENEGREKILSLLDWLDECNVDVITISIPYLVEIIRMYFPRMVINVSTIAHVDSVPKAKFWEMMGVDRITVDFMMNRDFEVLRSIRNAVKCELEVIVNDMCLFGCPFRYYHYNITAHASQEIDKESILKHRLAYSYPTLKCNLIKITDFSEIIKSPWIRPEDIRFYRDLGINFLKITGRTRPTNILLSYVKAYSEEIYRGNLLEIIPIPTAGMEDVRSLLKNSSIYVDNTKLGGFLDFFQSSKCRIDCYQCNYCEEVAKKVVTIKNQEQLDGLKNFLIERINFTINPNKGE